MAKQLESLVADIYNLFDTGHECNPERVKAFGETLSGVVAARLLSYGEERVPTLRMSNLGKPDRQLWYEINSPEAREELPVPTKIKFLYGDILEHLLLFLAEESGHDVRDQQRQVELDGIVGHIDATVDGVVVDVKSASTYSFKKFKSGELRVDDPFGYMEQLAGYTKALSSDGGAFLAIDKQHGHVALDYYSNEELEPIDIEARIPHVKGVVGASEVPERCYKPVEEGKSGNLVLGVGCNYCSFKNKCWSDANGGVGLRTFIYSTGPKHFTHIEREPNGPREVTF